MVKGDEEPDRGLVDDSLSSIPDEPDTPKGPDLDWEDSSLPKVSMDDIDGNDDDPPSLPSLPPFSPPRDMPPVEAVDGKPMSDADATIHDADNSDELEISEGGPHDPPQPPPAVSYTHLTLPTKRIV